jgi:thiol-disulfide isomerase/thioredoxin
MRMRGAPQNFEPPPDTSFFGELRKNWFLLLVVLLAAGGVYVMTRKPPPPPPPAMVSSTWTQQGAGQPLRDFTVFSRTSMGKPTQYYGRPKVVVGYSLDCEPCMLSLVTLDQLAADFGGKVDFMPIAIARRPGNLAEVIEQAYKKYGITNLAPYTMHESQAAGLFNDSALPTSYILDKNNLIVRMHAGPGNWNDETMHRALTQLSGGATQ